MLLSARVIATHLRFFMPMFQLRREYYLSHLFSRMALLLSIIVGCLITSTGDLYRGDGGCSSAIPLVPQGALDLHKIVCAANN